MAFSFRDVEHNLCIALDNQTPSLLCPGEECGANAVICYGYVDKFAGLTFEVLCLASYIDGDYTIVNENKSVGMKVRSETYKDIDVFPIKNAAIAKRFEDRIQLIEDNYYSNDAAEKAREMTCIDNFRHPFFPDDVLAVLVAQGLKAEQIWVRLLRYVMDLQGTDLFEGSLLNQPFDSNFNVGYGDKVYVAFKNDDDGERCLVVPKHLISGDL